MATNNSSNQNYANNSDGWYLAGGSTSRTLTLSGGDAVLSATGSALITFPSSTSTLATLGLAETITGAKTFADGTLKLAGVTSGVATLKAPGIASTYVVTLPEATTTLIGPSTTDTLTNKTLVSANVTTKIVPTTDDGATLGDTSFKFSDLFLASGAVINFQSGNTTITHSSNLLTLAGGGLALAAGTSAIAPLDFIAGTNLSSPAAGAMEYDGNALYFTTDTGSGRGVVPVEQRFRLTASGGTIGTTQANFFGANSNPTLVANAEYEIVIECYFSVQTANPVTWTFVNSAAPTQMTLFYTTNPTSGVVAPPGAATYLQGNIQNSTTATTTLTNTGSLTANSTQYTRFNIYLRNGAGTSLQIRATKVTAGTITPLAGSNWRVTRLPAANTGTFSA